MTVQAQILDLLDRLKQEFNAAIVDRHPRPRGRGRALRPHPGDVRRQDRRGGRPQSIYYGAHHPYTWGLLSSIPRLNESDTKERLVPIRGLPPSLIFVPPGCAFHLRPHVFDRCRTEVPELLPADGHHASRCSPLARDKERIFQEEVMARS